MAEREELSIGEVTLGTGAATEVFIRDTAGNAVLARGATVPADAAAGYAKGCHFIQTDGTNHTNTLYANIGNATTANFNAVTIAADA